jgi:hypothetical protein
MKEEKIFIIEEQVARSRALLDDFYYTKIRDF